MHSESSTPESPFTPILPFSTPSDLTSLYELGPELGRGQFGIIRRCTSRSSHAPFACKSISKLCTHTPRALEDIIREVSIMKSLSKSAPLYSIVQLHDVVEDCEFVHLIMDLCQGGDLFDRIVKRKYYSEAKAAALMKSLLETLKFCHGRGIMHRDLKPENILFVDESDMSPIKLADFGLALEFTPGQKVSGMAGSTFYMAPEILQGEYSERIDMWSAGVILYVLLSGVPPFWKATEEETLKAIQDGDLSFPPDPWAGISLSARDLVLGMICPDEEERLTPAQALKHPWILQQTKLRGRQAQRHGGFRGACITR